MNLMPSFDSLSALLIVFVSLNFSTIFYRKMPPKHIVLQPPPTEEIEELSHANLLKKRQAWWEVKKAVKAAAIAKAKEERKGKVQQ